MKHKINKLLTVKSEIDSVYGKLKEVTGLSPESRLAEALYLPFNMYLKCLSELIGDKGESLEWFVWENDCGESGLSAGCDKDLKPIKTVDDLIDLIRGSCQIKSFSCIFQIYS